MNQRFYLGNSGGGTASGFLMLKADTPSTELAKPDSLVLISDMDDVEEVTDNNNTNALRQVMSPECLADIIVSNDFRYTIKFYAANDVESQLDTNGYYVAKSGATPFASYTTENPAAATNDVDTLRIVGGLTGGETTNEYVYSQNGSTNEWAFSQGNGIMVERLQTSTNGNDRMVVRAIENSAQVVVAKTESTLRAYDWGEVLVKYVVDPDGAALTTTWNYYTDSTDTGRYARVKSVVGPDGSWERYDYNTDGYMTEKIVSWKDAATNAVASSARAFYYGYSAVDTNDTVAIKPYRPRTVTEKIEDIVVAKTYYAYYENGGSERVEIAELCASTNAAYGAAGNLRTERIYNPENAQSASSKRLKSVVYPDSRKGSCSYDFGTYSTNSNPSLNSFTVASTGNYVRVTLTHGTTSSPDGIANKSTREISIEDPAGRIVQEETYVYNGSGYERIDWIVTYRDDLGRPTTVHFADGTKLETTWACCGAASDTDREGIQTSYDRDALKRVVSTSRASITTSNTFDAAARVLRAFRNNVLISSNAYDLAGRLVSSTDALTNTTTFTESIDGDGHLVSSNQYPNATCMVEVHYKDGQLKEVRGSAVHRVRYEYGLDADGLYTKEIKLNADGTDTSEWTKTYSDMVGRPSLVAYSDGASSRSYYNNSGQLVKQVDPDGVTTLFQYDALGRVEYAAVDMDQDGVIDFSGTDRITRSEQTIVSAQGTTVRRTTTEVYTTEGTEATEVASISETSTDGLQSWQIGFGLTNHVQTVYDRPNAKRIVTLTRPDGSYSVSTNTNGRLVAVLQYSSTPELLHSMTYAYDSHGRMVTNTDARTGATIIAYNNGDQQTSVSAGGQTTSFVYDSLGRRTVTTLPDNASVTNEYHNTGELKKTYGARTYPVEYGYDYAGRMKTLITWKNYSASSGTATTTWNYSSTRGFLTSKVYDDQSSVAYSNTVGGRLVSRQWARGITTTYGYNNAGDLSSINYSDFTPDMTNVYDRRGRGITVTNGSDVASFTYNSAGQLLTESFPNCGVIVTNTYDSLLRRSAQSGTGILPVSYAYDAASRLSVVSNNTHTATYTYLPNSSLVSNIVFKTSGVTKMTTTKTYDSLNRLTSISSVPSASSAVTHSYTYNSANQRTRVDLADGSYWLYTYDALGQVVSGKRYWSDGTAVAGQQYEYGFDTIGNRTNTIVNSRSASYTANSLNQYTQRDVPGFLWELGSATNSATVTINNLATTRKGEYFSKELSVANATTAVFTQLVTVGVLKNAGSNQTDIVSTTTGKVFVAKSPELFSHDSDGNLTNDGRWAYSWDAENRLVSMETSASVTSVLSVVRTKLEFAYDHQSRRISKVVSNWNGSAWTEGTNLRFVYDGWNLAAELDKTNALVRSYTWGLDLSGSIQGVGGIGGLIAISASTNSYFGAYDGNGNVAALVDTSSGAESARFEYGPFGETIRVTYANPLVRQSFGDGGFRFSTKYSDAETGLLYYGYRYFQPSTGRWLGRDRIGEKGGVNLYSWVNNDPADTVDPTGQMSESACQTAVKNALKGNAKAKKILALMAKKKCDPSPICICCDTKNPGQGGWTDGITGKITLCADRAGTGKVVIEELVHELVHSWDVCNKADMNDCNVRACSEIKGVDFSGQCINGSGWRNQGESYKDCVKRLASDSATKAGCKVDDVLNNFAKCFGKL